MTVEPTATTSYFAGIERSAYIEGYNDGNIVFEWLVIQEDLTKFTHTGISDITFNNLRANTKYTILLFRAYTSGQLNGDLVKFEMTTLPEEATE